VFLSYLLDYLTCHKISRDGTDGFTSPPKDVVLRIFTAIKIPLSVAGSRPANLGPNDKHNKQWTSEDLTR
jgi:hypothetical protein